jgi:hypothetical protein
MIRLVFILLLFSARSFAGGVDLIKYDIGRMLEGAVYCGREELDLFFNPENSVAKFGAEEVSSEKLFSTAGVIFRRQESSYDVEYKFPSGIKVFGFDAVKANYGGLG